MSLKFAGLPLSNWPDKIIKHSKQLHIFSFIWWHQVDHIMDINDTGGNTDDTIMHHPPFKIRGTSSATVTFWKSSVSAVWTWAVFESWQKKVNAVLRKAGRF